MLKSVSIIVATYNSQHTIGELIEALLDQEYERDQLEIIIVDDGSKDQTSDIVKRYPVKYFVENHRGPAHARNIGWKHSCGEMICFTDSDCLPKKNWVKQLLSQFISEDIGGVGGAYDNADSTHFISACIHEEIVERHHRMNGNVNYLGTFNVAYRRSILEEVGGFNESYRAASAEDNDLSYRVIKQGYQLLFNKNITVAHYHSHHLFQYLNKQFWHAYWRMKLYADHRDRITGDSYAGPFDFFRPPLALISLILIFFSFSSSIVHLNVVLLAVLFFFQMPLVLKIVIRTRQISFFALAPLTFLREFVRGLGLILGFFKFFFLRV